MSRRCDLTDKGAQAGLKISHSNHKTHRVYNMNLHNVKLRSELLNREISLRIAVSTLRSVDHNGGLDGFLLTAKANSLSEQARKLRRQMKKAQLAQKAAA